MAADFNPFSHLVDPVRTRLPKTGSASVVVAGKRIDDIRQLKPEIDETDEEDSRISHVLAKKVRSAKAAARYQRDRQDPEKMAKRRAWYEANKDKVQAYKRKWDELNLQKLRQQQRDYAARARHADPEKFRLRQQEYYLKNREAILARKSAEGKAKRDAARHARLASEQAAAAKAAGKAARQASKRPASAVKPGEPGNPASPWRKSRSVQFSDHP